MEEMFCFQCQQTAHNTGCEGHTGVCGKKSDTANLQDELTGELIRLARAVTENERSRSSDELMLKGLFTTITNVNFNSDTVKKLSDEIREEAENRKPGKDAYNVQKIWGGTGRYSFVKVIDLVWLTRDCSICLSCMGTGICGCGDYEFLL